jgi:hypothetical protein
VRSSIRGALAAALWVLVSATAASADQRTVVGHSVKGRPIVPISSGDTERAGRGTGRRAAKSALTLAGEYASPEVSGATVAGQAK